jgi:hypothetical protein
MPALDARRSAPRLVPAIHQDLVLWLRHEAKANAMAAMDATDAWREQLAFDAAKKLREAAEIIEKLA